MIKVIDEARAKHWNDLACLAEKIVKWWRKYYFEGPHLPEAYILDDPDFESIDYILGQSLLDHLKAEFPDCRDMTHWRELVATKLKSDVVVSMRLVAFRRTFIGTCEICQSWEDAVTSGSVYSNLSDISSVAASKIRTQDAIDSLLKLKDYKELEESSLATYEKHFAIFAREFPILPIDQDILMEFLKRFNGKSGRTRLNWHSNLNMLYKHASEKFHVPNPLTGLPRPNIKHRPVKVTTLAEARVLNATPTTLRERVILDMLLGHGWRQIELRRITAEDVRNIRDGIIWIWGKERDEYTPILPETEQVLRELAEGLKPEDRVIRGQKGALGYDGLRKIIMKLYNRAGLKDFKGHDLRRTFATMVMTASQNELLAMRLLRDKVPGQSDRYLAITPAMLRNDLVKYSPLRLINDISPANLARECEKEAGEMMVETGESRTPRPEEAVQDILQA